MNIIHRIPLRLLVAYMIAALFSGCATQMSSSSDEWEMIDHARFLIAHQQYEEAETVALALVDLNPVSGNYGLLAQACEARGRFRQAIEARRGAVMSLEASRVGGGRPGAWKSLGSLYLARGEWENARSCIVKGYSILERGRLPELDALAKKHLRLNPWLWEYYACKGEYSNALSAALGALAFFQEYDQRDFIVAEIKHNLGLVCYAMGRYDDAYNYFQEASREGYPEVSYKSRIMLSRIQTENVDFAAAIDSLMRALALVQAQSNEVVTWITQESEVVGELGRVNLFAGDYSAAKEFFHKSLQLRLTSGTQGHPMTADIFFGLATIAAAEGDLSSGTLMAKQALSILESALEPTHPSIARTLVCAWALDCLTSKSSNQNDLWTRIEQLTSAPMGLWMNETEEAIALYIPILRRAGLVDAADWLVRVRSSMAEQRE